jgi:hypothetical protein
MLVVGPATIVLKSSTRIPLRTPVISPQEEYIPHRVHRGQVVGFSTRFGRLLSEDGIPDALETPVCPDRIHSGVDIQHVKGSRVLFERTAQLT